MRKLGQEETGYVVVEGKRMRAFYRRYVQWQDVRVLLYAGLSGGEGKGVFQRMGERPEIWIKSMYGAFFRHDLLTA